MNGCFFFVVLFSSLHRLGFHVMAFVVASTAAHNISLTIHNRRITLHDGANTIHI